MALESVPVVPCIKTFSKINDLLTSLSVNHPNFPVIMSGDEINQNTASSNWLSFLNVTAITSTILMSLTMSVNEIWNLAIQRSCSRSCQNYSLQWRHNERDGVSNHRCLSCLLNRLFRRRSKKTPKISVTGLCEGNPPVDRRIPHRNASNAENVCIWWRHHMA